MLMVLETNLQGVSTGQDKISLLAWLNYFFWVGKNYTYWVCITAVCVSVLVFKKFYVIALGLA